MASPRFTARKSASLLLKLPKAAEVNNPTCHSGRSAFIFCTLSLFSDMMIIFDCICSASIISATRCSRC
ncbi:hypothetical protein BMETH_78_1 [methanotrophic bacterial endosymbiont of Bathymodiolus sp.]|nr:hypothetical protein BMETH_78_1 [methanotrophic bacterial endosymbiont of Bathymodiolus sp.]